MNYTESFLMNIKLFGVPNFEPENFYRFLNIVAVESQIEGIKKFGLKFRSEIDSKEFSLELFPLYERLYSLTNRLDPDELWDLLGGSLPGKK